MQADKRQLRLRFDPAICTMWHFLPRRARCCDNADSVDWSVQQCAFGPTANQFHRNPQHRSDLAHGDG
ncbi:hypothetical protein BOO86_11095 [Mycobacterium sp. CBMA 234]|nr:hypothetical protein [Mycolicibacterium sp. CBMA 234]